MKCPAEVYTASVRPYQGIPERKQGSPAEDQLGRVYMGLTRRLVGNERDVVYPRGDLSVDASRYVSGRLVRAGTVLFDRQMLTVEVAFQNEDDFVKNLCTIRAEERAALAIPAPGALAKGSFASTP